MPWLAEKESSVVIHSSILKLLNDRNVHKAFSNIPDFTSKIFKDASIFYDFNHEARFNLNDIFPDKKKFGNI
jgi:hypothetical protein